MAGSAAENDGQIKMTQIKLFWGKLSQKLAKDREEAGMVFARFFCFSLFSGSL
jgi:hypothetical protein